MKKLLINRTVKVRSTHVKVFEPPIGVADYGCLVARAGAAPSEPPEKVRLLPVIELLRNLAIVVGPRTSLRFAFSSRTRPSKLTGIRGKSGTRGRNIGTAVEK
jgi:hypothetical protein